MLDGGSGGGLFVGGPGLGAGGELGGAGVVGGVGLVLVAAQLGLALAAGVGEAFELLQGFAAAGEAAGAWRALPPGEGWRRCESECACGV